jgi:thiol-disulfide isomerase/thioredoxin
MARILLPALVLALFTTAVPAADSGWVTGWPTATKAATVAKQPILANFTGSDWCGWCVRLKAEVFDTAVFKTWAARSVILLEVDFPQGKPQPEALQRENRLLAERLRIEGFPTIVLLSADGRELGRLGYQAGGPEAWTAAVDALLTAAAH